MIWHKYERVHNDVAFKYALAKEYLPGYDRHITDHVWLIVSLEWGAKGYSKMEQAYQALALLANTVREQTKEELRAVCLEVYGVMEF